MKEAPLQRWKSEVDRLTQGHKVHPWKKWASPGLPAQNHLFAPGTNQFTPSTGRERKREGSNAKQRATDYPSRSTKVGNGSKGYDPAGPLTTVI